MCGWQSVYVIFGFSGSIWMNVVITAELHRLASRVQIGEVRRDMLPSAHRLFLNAIASPP